jgi:hypothetical protein
VGKTYLISEFFRDRLCFAVTGQAQGAMAAQLGAFHTATQQYGGAELAPPRDWTEAFANLRRLIERSRRRGKKVVFFDEVPWLATDRSGFLPALEYFWNSWGARRADLLLIVCGSATSWMVDKVVHNTGGLYNRLTGSIYLQPFDLSETESFLHANGIRLDRYQIVEAYMIFGGVPQYLSLFQPGLSLAQNVDRLCFAPDAVLRNEFDNVFLSLFKSPERHISVVRALGRRARGLTRQEIVADTGLPNSGRLTQVLTDLTRSGFVRQYHAFGKQTRDTLHQLVDPFTLFARRYLEGEVERNPHFWSDVSATGQHNAWTGYAFEQVALLHVEQIRAALGIAGVLTDYSSWTGSADGRRAQIDLIFDRNDHVINLCEMKYARGTYSVTAAAERQLRRKWDVFTRSTGTPKTVHYTLVTTYGLHPDARSGVYQSVVTMADLFRDSA